MGDEQTTMAVQRFLLELEGAGPHEPVVRALLGRAAGRLELLCGAMLFRSYPRLSRPPLNLQSQELLGSVVARLLRAMQEVRPTTARQFFALASRHIRWELNDLARQLDEHTAMVALPDAQPAAELSTGSVLSVKARRILDAIDALPEEDREVFDLVRIQGLTHGEAAELLEVSTKTVQRRLAAAIMELTQRLGDLVQLEDARGGAAGRDGRDLTGNIVRVP